MDSKVTTVKERIIKLRTFHNLGVTILASVYVPTGVSKFSLTRVLRPDPDGDGLVSKEDTLIVRVDFNATTGTARMAMSRVGHHVSARNTK